MDSYQQNQIEDGFDQIEDKQGSVQEAKKLKGSPTDEGIVENAASRIKICDFCGKTLSNGKALGGHRRHHFQALRKEAAASAAAQSQLKVKIRLPNRKNYENSSSFNDVDEDYNFMKMEEALMSDGGKTTCDLCNKEFTSMKSDYGHMRTHPERDRGTVLPPDDDSEEFKEDDCVTTSTVSAPVESPIDLTKSLKSWSKTDLRGRKCIGAIEAAQNLISLSRGVCFSAPKSPILGMSPNMLPQAASTDDAGETKSIASRVATQFKEKKVNDSPSKEQNVVRIKEFHRRGSLNERKDEKEEQGDNWSEEYEKDMKDDDTPLDESKMKNIEKRKKILKLKFPQSSEYEENPLIKTLKTLDDGCKCIICGKSFATFQALRRHTSSHNKGKNIIIGTMNEPGDDNSAGFIPQVINETKGSEPKGLVVEEVDTAQDLGDHHRKSPSSRSSAETPLSEEASSVRTGLSHSTHQEVTGPSPLAPRALDFDLNEPYVSDEKSN